MADVAPITPPRKAFAHCTLDPVTPTSKALATPDGKTREQRLVRQAQSPMAPGPLDDFPDVPTWSYRKTRFRAFDPEQFAGRAPPKFSLAPRELNKQVRLASELAAWMTCAELHKRRRPLRSLKQDLRERRLSKTKARKGDQARPVSN